MTALKLWNSALTAEVDESDVARVSSLRWNLMQTKGHRYARASVKGKYVLLHRFLVDAAPGQLIDHRDGNGLNCQRANLRTATCAQNNANRVSRTGTGTGVPGVHAVKTGWIVRFMAAGKVRYFGHFKDFNEAAEVAKAASIEVHGEFSPFSRLPVTPTDLATSPCYPIPPTPAALESISAAKRLIAFMRVTGSLAPLQWMADQMGCDLTVRNAVSAQLAEARARVAELERQGRMAA